MPVTAPAASLFAQQMHRHTAQGVATGGRQGRAVLLGPSNSALRHKLRTSTWLAVRTRIARGLVIQSSPPCGRVRRATEASFHLSGGVVQGSDGICFPAGSDFMEGLLPEHITEDGSLSPRRVHVRAQLSQNIAES